MDFEGLTDEALMARAALGDDDAFAEIIRRHQDLIYGTTVRMMGFAEAEDVAQEVFIKAYRAAARYKPEAKFTTWLLTICRHTVFSHLKKRRRWSFFAWNTGENSEGEEREIPDTSQSHAPQQMMQQELERALQDALGILPENQRMAIILREYDQMDYEEIGKVLGLSLGSVKSLLFRARDTLKQKLNAFLTAT